MAERAKAGLRKKPAIMDKTIEQVVHEAVRGQATQQNPAFEAMLAEHLKPPAPPEDMAAWPMAVQEFQNGGYLEPGDVILTTKLDSFFSSLVRRFDKSSFAHAALVLFTPHHEDGIDHTFLIETSMNGIDISTFSEIAAPTKKYKDTGEPPSYVVGIKRLETEWSTISLRRMVASRMLHFIDLDNYNYSLLMALANRRLSKFYFRLRNLFFGRGVSLAEYLRRGGNFSPDEFICSGFVQFAYVDMLRTAIERGMIPPDYHAAAWSDVLFAQWIKETSSMEDLITVKPRELAESDKLQWKYLIHGGKAYRVRSNQDVNSFFKEIRATDRLVEA